MLNKDSGNYHAWGETSYDNGYSLEDYKFGLGRSYNRHDRDSILASEDDSVTSLLDTLWRMPTAAEAEKLRGKCNWGELVGYGYVIYGPNGNCIFMPESGYKKQIIMEIPVWSIRLLHIGLLSFLRLPYIVRLLLFQLDTLKNNIHVMTD